MMKRGFIFWDRREIGEDDFRKRKERIIAKMREEQLGYLLVYGDVWQSDEVRYLTNFNTYTRDCVAGLSLDGKMSIVSSMTPRDREWIAGFTPVAGQDIYFAAGLVKASDVMKKDGFTAGRIGLVGHFFPTVLFDHLEAEFPGTVFIDLTTWYRELRRVSDAADLGLVKRAALLAQGAARVLTDPGLAGKKETEASAQAEWLVRSRGGEDYVCACSSGKDGFMHFPGERRINDYFAFSLLVQYKGCWASMERTFFARGLAADESAALAALASGVRQGTSLEGLMKLIEEAKADQWVVAMKSPIGPDGPSSIVPCLAAAPTEVGAVFSLSFSRETEKGLLAYGETVYIGEEGYEVCTA